MWSWGELVAYYNGMRLGLWSDLDWGRSLYAYLFWRIFQYQWVKIEKRTISHHVWCFFDFDDFFFQLPAASSPFQIYDIRRSCTWDIQTLTYKKRTEFFNLCKIVSDLNLNLNLNCCNSNVWLMSLQVKQIFNDDHHDNSVIVFTLDQELRIAKLKSNVNLSLQSRKNLKFQFMTDRSSTDAQLWKERPSQGFEKFFNIFFSN